MEIEIKNTSKNYKLKMGMSHKSVTGKAFEILKETDRDIYESYSVPRETCPEIRQVRQRAEDFHKLSSVKQIIEETKAVDTYNDVELVDVEGLRRDDPHKKEWSALDDKAHYTEHSRYFTSFNHFIDIRKGPGIFDDYDGYSYYKGSASVDEYQDASEEAKGLLKVVQKVIGQKIDENYSWWFNDEYVHAPCHKWYNGCSPAVERYSFPEDKGKYSSVLEELAERFPLAESRGAKGKGMPYSVFMPVDNLARYWYNRYVTTGDHLTAAPVLHAIQDATVPHHTSGTCGNYHKKYERELDAKADAWLSDESFSEEVKDLVQKWSTNDSSSPEKLDVKDWDKEPSMNWSIDKLVTWLALNSYREYKETYGNFEKGYKFDDESAKKLTKLATAMSVLFLKKAFGEANFGN